MKRALPLLVITLLGACRANDHEARASHEALTELLTSGARITLDATADRIAWESRGHGPLARSGHAAAFDAEHRVTVMFGGQSGSALDDDTWLWDGTNWTQACLDALCVASHPPARFGHAMAYDRARNVVVLYGGQGASAILRDTWEWDGASWRNACTASCASSSSSTPGPRFGHAIAFDSARNESVVFGGSACAGNSCTDLADTWEWDGSIWTNPGTSGPARAGHAMAFDAARARTVLFGGTHLGPLDDTWTWDGQTWAQASAASHPAHRAYAALAYDKARHALTLFGGAGAPADAWSWDGTTWQSLPEDSSPPRRSSHAMAFDEHRARLVLYGGYGGGDLDDTWEAHRYAGSCATDAECETGHCIDDVCCASVCATCETCNGLSPGFCTIVGGDDPDSCTGDRTCDARGRCLTRDRKPCAARAECASGFCVDSVCCTTACTGSCQTCRASLGAPEDGTCGPIARGTDPHDECPDEGACLCQRDGFCDGQGACEVYAPGRDCGACGDPLEHVRFKYQCDGLGACAPTLPRVCVEGHILAEPRGKSSDCSPYQCTEDAVCRETCSASDDCAPPFTCDARGTCSAPPDAPTPPLSNGCNIHASSDIESALPAEVAMLLLAIAYRRRRATKNLSARAASPTRSPPGAPRRKTRARAMPLCSTLRSRDAPARAARSARVTPPASDEA